MFVQVSQPRIYSKFKGCLFLLRLSLVVVAVEGRAQEKSKEFSILEKFDTEKIREELIQWDQSVRGFRKMHHFLVMTGPTDGTWRVRRFADRFGETFRDEGLMTKLFYSYHLQIFQNFGYFLGTGVGYWQNLGIKEKDSGFNVQSIEQIPGVLLGLTLNLTPGLRISGGLYYGMERIRKFSYTDTETGEKTTMTGTARSFDWLFTTEAFYKLDQAISLTYYVRDQAFNAPKNALGYAVDAQIRKSEDWLAVGFTYHLL